MKRNVNLTWSFAVAVLLAAMYVSGYSFSGHAAAVASQPVVTGLSCPQPNITLSCPEAVCPAASCSLPACPYVPPHFMQVMETVKDAREYNKGTYVCREYAKELWRRLDTDGYDAYYCEGKLAGEGHAWVRIGRTGIVLDPTLDTHVTPDLFSRSYSGESCWRHI